MAKTKTEELSTFEKEEVRKLVAEKFCKHLKVKVGSDMYNQLINESFANINTSRK
jgi:uncharacterized protein (DUF2164 family)